MDEVRLIDGNALEQEMREFAAQIFVGCRRTTTDSEEAVHTCADMVSEAKTIDPEDLPPCWRKSVEDPPTREDGNAIGSVLATGYHCNIRDGLWLENIMPWHVVRDNPGTFPLWMPLPKLPDLPVPERRCMMGND